MYIQFRLQLYPKSELSSETLANTTDPYERYTPRIQDPERGTVASAAGFSRMSSPDPIGQGLDISIGYYGKEINATVHGAA